MCGIAISTSLFQGIGIIYKCCWPLPSHPGYIASSSSSRIVVEVFVFINTRNSKIGRVFTNSSLKCVSGFRELTIFRACFCNSNFHIIYNYANIDEIYAYRTTSHQSQFLSSSSKYIKFELRHSSVDTLYLLRKK